MAWVATPIPPSAEKSDNFRDYLIPLDHPRLFPRDRDPRTHAKAVLGNPEIFLTDVANGWLEKYEKPYNGFTADGNVVPNLYQHQPDPEGPTSTMLEAAKKLLSAASSEESSKFRYPVHAREWRSWSNPEVIVVDSGLRLDEMSESTRSAVLELLKASLSSEGYEKLTGAMDTNHFLGELTKLTNVMNRYSYHFCLFGEPSATEPWGFNLFGHHMCVNVLTLNGEVSVGPFFVGAEPNVIDDGEMKGITVLNKEETAGLAFMKSLSEDQRKKATLKGDINDIDGSTMDKGRWNPADLRGLGGAFQDNRVVPLEGLSGKDMTPEQRKELLGIVRIFNELLPDRALEHFMERVEKHLDETHFGWIGPVDDENPFYYRVHSPVVMDEFDHHNGVWLSNIYPKKYHIHTIQRLPNRGDYGVAIMEDWKKGSNMEPTGDSFLTLS